jgi:guanylate kinase
MTHWTEFDHVIVNDDFPTALARLAAVIHGEERTARTDLPEVRAIAEAIVEGRR